MATALSTQGPQWSENSVRGSATASQTESANGEIILIPHQQPSMNDLRSMAADIKDSLMAAITDPRIHFQAIMGRVQAVKKTAALHSNP